MQNCIIANAFSFYNKKIGEGHAFEFWTRTKTEDWFENHDHMHYLYYQIMSVFATRKLERAHIWVLIKNKDWRLIRWSWIHIYGYQIVNVWWQNVILCSVLFCSICVLICTNYSKAPSLWNLNIDACIIA